MAVRQNKPSTARWFITFLILAVPLPLSTVASASWATKEFSLSYAKTTDSLGANVDTLIADWRPRYDLVSWLSAGAVISFFPLVADSRTVFATNQLLAVSLNTRHWGLLFLGGFELWTTSVIRAMPAWGAAVTFRWTPFHPMAGFHLTFLNPRLDGLDILGFRRA